MFEKINEQTEKELNEAFGRMNQALDKMDKQFDEMINVIDKSLETVHDLEDVKVMIVKKSWKNTVIERIMYFLLGGLVGFIIYFGYTIMVKMKV